MNQTHLKLLNPRNSNSPLKNSQRKSTKKVDNRSSLPSLKLNSCSSVVKLASDQADLSEASRMKTESRESSPPQSEKSKAEKPTLLQNSQQNKIKRMKQINQLKLSNEDGNQNTAKQDNEISEIIDTKGYMTARETSK